MKEIVYIFYELINIFKSLFKGWTIYKKIFRDIALFSISIIWYLVFLIIIVTWINNLWENIWIIEILFFIIAILSIKFIYLLTIRTVYKFWKNNSIFLLLTRLTLHILLFILSFAFIFLYINLIFPNSFSIVWYNFIDYFYYSAITFTTLWYWDILPLTYTAKLFATIEIISGYILIILMVSNVHNMKESVVSLNIEPTNKEWYLRWFSQK